MDQEAGPAGAQAEPGYRGAFEPVRPAAASPRPRVCEDAPRPAVRARPSRPVTWTQPSWPAVLATTARLWLARHVHRPGRGLRLACLTVLTLAIATAAGLFAAQQDLLGTSSGSQVSGGAPDASSSAAVRGLAAGWLARQVGGDVIVACDPVMCAAMAASGFPAARLMPLAPGRAGLPSADLVVATQAVRGYFAGRLAREYAPLVIASFGAGPAQIQIRQVAPGGAAAFLRRFDNGRIALRQAATELLKNSRITVSATARAALVAGRVDGRLLTVLAALAARRPLRVLGFTDANPGAAPGVPMRTMLLAGSDPTAHLPGPAYGRSLVRFLGAQPAPYHPARCSMMRQSSGPDAIGISFAAPSPAGL